MNHVHLFHICRCFNLRTLFQMTHSYAYTSSPVQWIFQSFIPIAWDSAEKLCEVIIIGINHALYRFHHGFRYGIGVHYKTGETQTDFHFDYSTIFCNIAPEKSSVCSSIICPNSKGLFKVRCLLWLQGCDEFVFWRRNKYFFGTATVGELIKLKLKYLKYYLVLKYPSIEVLP